MTEDRGRIQTAFTDRYDQWVARADELVARAREVGGVDAPDVFADELNALHDSRRILQEGLIHLRDAGEAEWAQLREDAERAADRFKLALEDLRGKVARRPKE